MYHFLCAHNFPADGSWQSIDEEDQKDDEDDQNESDDYVLFVISPYEVVEALEGTHKPGEGGVWTAEEESKRRSGWDYHSSPR